MTGRIIKALADFYYIYCDQTVYQCKAKGLFRKEKMTPLVGDLVDFELTGTEDIEGNVVLIHERTSCLSRPAVANVDKCLLTFAVKDPQPNFYLTDRFLSIMEDLGIEVILCFNKSDLGPGPETLERIRVYKDLGYKCLLCSTYTGEGTEEIKSLLNNSVTTVAGPSGVGKSSIINLLCGKERMETGAVSGKNRRGRQTTRHTELNVFGKDSFIVDTPGFSSTDISPIKKEKLFLTFREFTEPEKNCRFSECSHITEPDCGVRDALLEGKIFPGRYESYKAMYKELSEIKRY